MSSNLQLDLHWHVLLADGVWTEHDGHATFHPANPLDTMRVQETLHDAGLRIDKVLKGKGWQDRADDPFADAEPALAQLWKAALLGRPIDESEARQKKAQLRGLPRPHGQNCAEMNGFSLHANTFVGPAARDELYKLVKYLCRPSIAGKRVTEQEDGGFCVQLKTAQRWPYPCSSSPPADPSCSWPSRRSGSGTLTGHEKGAHPSRTRRSHGAGKMTSCSCDAVVGAGGVPGVAVLGVRATRRCTRASAVRVKACPAAVQTLRIVMPS